MKEFVGQYSGELDKQDKCSDLTNLKKNIDVCKNNVFRNVCPASCYTCQTDTESKQENPYYKYISTKEKIKDIFN